MEESTPSAQEAIGEQLIEDIKQLQCVALGVGAGTCQVCGEEIPEGGPVAVYAFRRAGASHWRVGHCKCDEDRPQETENFTLGVRELLVDGRVGRVIDQATQSDWPVLLAPRVRAVSPAATTDVFDVRGLPPHVRTSRLARASDPSSPAESRESAPTGQESSTTLDVQSSDAPREVVERDPDSAQLTFGDLTASATGEDAS
jgi:hypothetical protein